MGQVMQRINGLNRGIVTNFHSSQLSHTFLHIYL